MPICTGGMDDRLPYPIPIPYSLIVYTTCALLQASFCEWISSHGQAAHSPPRHPGLHPPHCVRSELEGGCDRDSIRHPGQKQITAWTPPRAIIRSQPGRQTRGDPRRPV